MNIQNHQLCGWKTHSSVHRYLHSPLPPQGDINDRWVYGRSVDLSNKFMGEHQPNIAPGWIALYSRTAAHTRWLIMIILIPIIIVYKYVYMCIYIYTHTDTITINIHGSSPLTQVAYTTLTQTHQSHLNTVKSPEQIPVKSKPNLN
jgi:hypothetical protein